LGSIGRRLQLPSMKRLPSRESKRLQENEVIFDPNHGQVGLAKRLRVLPESSFGWTQNCIVLDQQRLPDYIFTDFETLHNGKVVTEFAYIKEGYRRKDGSFVTESNKQASDTPTSPDINYNLSIASDPAASYVRVITKNSYYRDLFTTMFRATLSLQSEYNNLTFISVILKRPDLNSNSASRTFVMVFISMFIVLECWRVRAAMNLARREWERDEKAGDLIQEKHLDQIRGVFPEQLHGVFCLPGCTEAREGFARHAAPMEGCASFCSFQGRRTQRILPWLPQ
jgi:hypothetical protein